MPDLLNALPLLVLFNTPAPSQAAATASLPDHRPGVSLRVERRIERFDYHVENPSNFEPGPLVPHFFEHRYDADNTWLLVRAAYLLGGAAVATEAGITPRITTPGSDIDTFFQPSGEIITSGTRGDVQLRALVIRQWIELTTWRAWMVGLSVGYRRYEMDFLASDRIVTRSRPPSEIREPVGGNETTWSHVVESGVTASRVLALGPRWHVLADLEAVPLTRARLTISLPLKYPGELIRQDTFSFGARGRVAVERRIHRVSAGGAVTLGGAWGYRRRADYGERRAGGEVFLKIAPH